MTERNSLNAVICDKQEVSPGLYILRVKPDEGVPEFLPGQYIALGAPADQSSVEGNLKLVKRSYSIASPPSQKDSLEFYIIEVEGGALTPHLLALPVGARVHVGRRPVGTFTLGEIADGADLYFVSTGTGLAPFLSMLYSEQLVTGDRNIFLLHGVRYSHELGYRAQLEQLATEHKHFHYLPTVSREDPNWVGARGYVQRFFIEGALDPRPDRDHVFLCGNPSMIEELERYFQQLGFVTQERKTVGNLHCEKYW